MQHKPMVYKARANSMRHALKGDALMPNERGLKLSNCYALRVEARLPIGLRQLSHWIMQSKPGAIATVHNQTAMLAYGAFALIVELVVYACLWPAPQFIVPGHRTPDLSTPSHYTVEGRRSPFADHLTALYYRTTRMRGSPPWLYLETGDLASLKQRGKLRILAVREHNVKYPANSTRLVDVEQQMIAEFANDIGVEPVWVYVDKPADLVRFLALGKGDLIAYTAPLSPTSTPEIAYTLPIALTRYQLVAHADDDTIHGPTDLAGRRVALKRVSPAWGVLQQLKTQFPTIEIQTVPDYLSEETIVERVASGQYDAIVTDSANLKTISHTHLNIKAVFDLTDDRPVAWATRVDAIALLASLNKYLNQYQPARRIPDVYKDDLPGLKQRGVLRVITQESPLNFFQSKGELLGFEYDLARRFAEQNKLRLEMLVAPTDEAALTWLREGKGDIVAASLAINDGHSEELISYSRPYNYATYTIVSNAKKPHLLDLDSLSDSQLVIPHHSPLWHKVDRLKSEGIAATFVEAPREFATKEIVEHVAQGNYELAVVDSHELAIELALRDDIKAHFSVGEPVPISWAVRAANNKLLAAINNYFKKEYRGKYYNLAYRKYFQDSLKTQQHLKFATEQDRHLSPYDDFVRKYSEKYNFDWRLIVAQMYQESRFNPHARSRAGAEGLMQILPRTAKQLGYSDVQTPELGISAGIEYLNWLRERFQRELAIDDRTWFALAAYNAGYGRVEDARRLAQELGLDPNRWFDNVERALYLLGQNKYKHRSRFRRCRCGQTVAYVSDIRARYHAYVHLTEPLQLALTSRQNGHGS